ncbi:MAG TPA: hypothetical protein VN673_12420 [Clostridia bacterium]|nr:hypothetical protein [Clostridia bacterium]
MILEQANKLIRACADRMNTLYGKVVFDEWAVVSLVEGRGLLLAYTGPRKEGFQKNFISDAGVLRTGLMADDHAVGDFEFSRHSPGTGFESFMVLGKGLFLICNNTVQSMDSIAKDPLWLGAQVPFVELSERFQEDPLQAGL